ncbi:uncharacterized protein F4807DRAFT_433757 [Annulohypoxylon truncatum]|uniref:uncharacterized protein n=1 Tax=Annulohypoxylon truncatum TaxID=327061 RepID=UPI002008B237|nr:uncharacterized protein F4807DRAFT_433757 [Annulohypoxylon truncatum]KAI1207927.1 hypothetical protein F4807DRAFT_433757 [Annulohypoxylon truncatum]
MSIITKIRNALTQNYPPRPKFTEADIPSGSQKGKVFMVTGGNAGIGFELCKLLFRSGATVYMACRSQEKARVAIQEIQNHYGENAHGMGQLKALHLDLSDLPSIKEAARQFAQQEPKLDVLWNNAGIGGNAAKFGEHTTQGLEPLIGINCVGALFFTELLLPQLTASRASETAGSAQQPTARVVWVTSALADTMSPKNGIDFDSLDSGIKDRVANYAAAKAGVWILAREFARRHGKDGIISLPVNPGNVRAGSYNGTGAFLMWILNTLMLYDVIYGAYTEAYGGLSPSITLKDNGIYIMPWGRVRYDHDTPRQDIIKAMNSEEEGGLGYGRKLWDWCEAKWKPYV